jgi:hypothetical protein
METSELNRDYKRLYKKRLKLVNGNDSAKYYKAEPEIKKELSRLYGADNNFQYINKTSVLIFMELNRIFQVQPMHMIFPKIIV